MRAVKVKKNKRKTREYIAGATKVGYMIKNEEHQLWLAVIKNLNGGFSYFLTRSAKENREDVIKECFEEYGLRWKIEEYHRHIKLLIENGIKTMNKNAVYELFNFVYYKIGNIIKTLFTHVKPRAFLPDGKPQSNRQLCLALNWTD